MAPYREKGRKEGNGGLDLYLLSTECGDRRDGPCFIVLPACGGHQLAVMDGLCQRGRKGKPLADSV